MLPITLVTGFLGTGKTTLLRRIVAVSRNRQIVYLVNEFSPRDIDGAVIAAESPNVVAIPGGSIFCKCLVSEFIAQLRNISAERGSFEGVVIEASGMANPKVIGRMLTETGLDKDFRLASIISVIDPNSFLKLRHTLPNIVAQIEAADIVVINKTDLNPPERTAEAEAVVAAINPRAERRLTVNCNTDLTLFPERAPHDMDGEYAKCRDPNYHTFTTCDDFSAAELEKFISAHSNDIYRVKGTLRGELFEHSSSGFSRQERPDAVPVLVWIVRGSAAASLLPQVADIPLRSS